MLDSRQDNERNQAPPSRSTEPALPPNHVANEDDGLDEETIPF